MIRAFVDQCGGHVGGSEKEEDECGSHFIHFTRFASSPLLVASLCRLEMMPYPSSSLLSLLSSSATCTSLTCRIAS